ncbi:MAG: hypothetical protein QS98_C0007G0018 [archaeon GW2011_AR3]|nr:MAG: hypothetical protein QS98_C0007G0018 [archaeon GW2011_AR3]MBS3108929.1 hypothetical protein [Candidatus Woesearchaeota archaeon]
MSQGLIKVTPNRERAKSILKIIKVTLDMIEHIDSQKYPSNVTKEYYEIIRELASVLLLLDGWKAYGEGAHKIQIQYLRDEYAIFSQAELMLMDELRIIRNKIAYDGLFLKPDYLNRRKEDIRKIIGRLQDTIKLRL